ncbi:hypothetical protein [Polaribacter ponticola]|uniref:Uncharacterized protein n=1 Tax=Polaribacter ponticola TaxID=2978475 RepID=A0ABT5SD35_9FLAO|nr:hypothetical protein [Polaribacter sp. MSW5]MDD7916027.1 hypothetical protein [Polaribacter sp. MSW5]
MSITSVKKEAASPEAPICFSPNLIFDLEINSAKVLFFLGSDKDKRLSTLFNWYRISVLKLFLLAKKAVCLLY